MFLNMTEIISLFWLVMSDKILKMLFTSCGNLKYAKNPTDWLFLYEFINMDLNSFMSSSHFVINHIQVYEYVIENQ